jgi:deazaflavin-dependent oxidoreductase (nitroreductase family)
MNGALASQRTIKSLFFISYLIANLSLVLYGVLVLVMPDILLEPFQVDVYRFPADAADATGYFAALFRLLGFFNILPGVFGLWLLDHLRLSWEKWIVQVVTFSTALAYLGPIVFDNTVGRIGFFEIVEHILFVLVIVLGFFVWKDQDGRSRITVSHPPEATVRHLHHNKESDVVQRINGFGSTLFGVWTIKHLFSPLQVWVYHSTGGRFFTKIGPDRNVLLLTTKGRLTGKDRTTPVFYLRDGESIIICNVNPGFEHTNPWVVNLRANPLAQLQIGRETGRYQAREATETEIEKFWPRLTALWPAYDVHYQRGGRRTVFVLDLVEPLKVPSYS